MSYFDVNIKNIDEQFSVLLKIKFEWSFLFLFSIFDICLITFASHIILSW